jgi:hypothetical protein
MGPIRNWLQKSISMDVKGLPDLELVRFFLENQFLQKYHPNLALEALYEIQHTIDTMQVCDFSIRKPL